jgi:hypothetical protein
MIIFVIHLNCLKMKYRLLPFLLLHGILVSAQFTELKPEYSSQVSGHFMEITSPPLKEKQLAFSITPSQADMKYNHSLKHPISKNESEYNDDIDRIKASKDYLKKYPHNINRVHHGEEHPTGAEIIVGTSFYGDIDGSCPNDNTIAISKTGRIMSMMNEYVGIYTSQGAKLNVYSLNDFFSNHLTESLCDPKVEYDPISDRFFMFIQACNSDPQNIAFGFSKTNDPNGAWAIYLFESDALNDGSWSDYPKVAINRDEIFVSLNLFGRGSSGKYRQSICYQLNKNDGYNSRSLRYKIWTGFQPGTILPIRSGAFGQYGPGIYALQASAGGADYFNFYDITGSLSDQNSKLLYQKISTTAYEPSGNAYQLGTSVRLDIGDCRLQDGYYQDGIIHFVFSADDQGFSGIRYHRLDPSILNANKFELFSSSDLRDYCYPSISPFSNSVKDKTSVIHFTSSGENHYPDIRAKLFFDDFSSATSIRVKVGPGPHTSCYSSSKDYARWGDYSGIARHYSALNPTVWIAGSVGNNIKGNWWTYLAQLYTFPSSIKNQSLKSTLDISPNPAEDRFKVSITTDKRFQAKFLLKDLSGKLISQLYDGVLIPGENSFSFNTTPLSNGIYFLLIESNQYGILQTEKISIHR